MKIYTVSHAEQSPLDHKVDAAFPTRKAAVTWALRLMLERLDRCDAFRSALVMVPEIRMKTGGDPRNLRRDSVLEWIQSMLDSVGRIDVKDNSTGRRFSYSVTETNLTGPVWVTVTKGDGDTEDSEFTTPWPDMYASKAAAVADAAGYVSDMREASGMSKLYGDELSYFKTTLSSKGGYTADLSDGRSVSVVLYETDFKNVW